MSGQRRMDAHMRRFGIAHFADHDHIRVLAQERPQRRGKCQADRRMNLRLVDSRNLIFDWILDREDLADRFVERGKRRGERGGLPDPVGPVTMIIPNGICRALRRIASSRSKSPI